MDFINTTVMPLPNCWSCIVTNYVLGIIIFMLILVDVLFLIRFGLKKYKKVYRKKRRVVSIGRTANSRHEANIKIPNAYKKENITQEFRTLHEKDGCPIVIPSIKVMYDHENDFMIPVNKDMPNLQMNNPLLNNNAKTSLSQNSKPSGEYADLILDNSCNILKGNKSTDKAANLLLHPPANSTPLECLDKEDGPLSSYMTPVNWKNSVRSNKSVNDTSEVFENENSGRGIRNFIVSTFRSIPMRISSTISTIGDNQPVESPTKSPKRVFSSKDAIYLSFQNNSTNEDNKFNQHDRTKI